MPGFTYVHYDGSDDQIIQLISRLLNTSTAIQPPLSQSAPSSTWDEIAKRFEQYVSAASAGGSPSQKKAMLAWLRANGSIELTKLWTAAGVRTQHDYSGVGGSLTKNMIKARGPRDWYTFSRDNSGEWIYTIVPELVGSLKRCFGVK